MTGRTRVSLALWVLAIVGVAAAALVPRSTHRAVTAADGATFQHPPIPARESPALAATPNKANVGEGFRVEVAGLTRRLEASPRDTAALARLGQLWNDGHQPEQAIVYYRRYLEVDATNRQIWLDLTESYGSLGRWEDAIASSRALLTLHPDDPAAMYNLGAIHANRGEFEEARTWWNRVRQRGGDTTLVAMATASLERLPGIR